MAAAGNVGGAKGSRCPTRSDLSYGLQFSDCHLDDRQSASAVAAPLAAAVTILMLRGDAAPSHSTAKCDPPDYFISERSQLACISRLKTVSNNSVLKVLRVRRLAVIQEGIC